MPEFEYICVNPMGEYLHGEAEALDKNDLAATLWTSKLFLVFSRDMAEPFSPEALRALQNSAPPELSEQIRQMIAAHAAREAARRPHFHWPSWPNNFFQTLKHSKILVLAFILGMLATLSWDLLYYHDKQVIASHIFNPVKPLPPKFLMDKIQIGMTRADVEKLFRQRAGGTTSPYLTRYLVNNAVILIGFDGTGGPDNKNNKVSRLPKVTFLAPV